MNEQAYNRGVKGRRVARLATQNSRKRTGNGEKKAS